MKRYNGDWPDPPDYVVIPLYGVNGTVTYMVRSRLDESVCGVYESKVSADYVAQEANRN